MSEELPMQSSRFGDVAPAMTDCRITSDPPPLPFREAWLAPLEAAAAALARLDAALDSHPLAAAWLYRARLDAARREAAVDGQLIDPWHLAAVIEGVRFRMIGNSAIDRGATFAAARHALDLYRWRVHPGDERQEEVARAARHLEEAAGAHSPLIGAAIGVHAWINGGGGRGAIRAALSRYWIERGVSRLPLPLSGATALSAETPWTIAAWTGEFLGALAAEADDGLHLLRVLERDWHAGRYAVRERRHGSYAAAAVDVLAAAPVISAPMLASALGIAPKNAGRLLESFTLLGIAVEVTHRSKRRLYGLKYLAPLREATQPARSGQITARGRGRPPATGVATRETVASDPVPTRIAPFPPLSRVSVDEFEFAELDGWMAAADAAIRRVQAALGMYGEPSESREDG